MSMWTVYSKEVSSLHTAASLNNRIIRETCHQHIISHCRMKGLWVYVNQGLFSIDCTCSISRLAASDWSFIIHHIASIKQVIIIIIVMNDQVWINLPGISFLAQPDTWVLASSSPRRIQLCQTMVICTSYQWKRNSSHENNFIRAGNQSYFHLPSQRTMITVILKPQEIMQLPQQGERSWMFMRHYHHDRLYLKICQNTLSEPILSSHWMAEQF